MRVHGFLRPVEDLDLIIETTDPSPSGWVTVEMTSNAARPSGEPQSLPGNLDPQVVLDITSDFQRLLVAQRQRQSTTNPATVILNWRQMLKN